MATTATPPTKPAKTTAGRPRPGRFASSPRTGGLPLVRFYRSAVGKKWVMAVTGVMLMGFVLVHLIGNLKLFFSKEEINLYGEALRDMPGHLLPRTLLLWVAPHRTDRRVRAPPALRVQPHDASTGRRGPQRYQSKRDYVAADFASRTMRWTGIIVVAVPRVPPHGSHVGHRELRVRARRSVQQPRVQPAAARGRDRLRRREHRARVPPVPRRLVDVPEHGRQQPAHQQAAPHVRDGLRRPHPHRQPELPDPGADSDAVDLECPHTQPTTAPCKAS